MFTGLIEELGTVVDRIISGTSQCLKIKAECVFLEEGRQSESEPKILQNGLKIGDSIAVNGVCLTAERVTPPFFEVTCVRETLEKTTLGSLTIGTRINLERAATPITRLGGHLVTGHVDGIARVLEIREMNGSWEFLFGLPPGAERYVVPMGSIAIDGISLTVAAIQQRTVKIAIIPHTFRHTNIQNLKTGDEVNVELDQISKMVERLIGGRVTTSE
ncbi:MAG: riboflavin synthase [Bacteroidota bacterium]|nr:riboflavin synthase [Bacteroidota bacterium]MDP4234662.1 riboflavin synthase [Bacteroidota bacterium]MDP4243827.1 riboflavin synthase [Bacteroidota bacterium]MDP4288582.1 riboflavin synthase [Bacteroidota bacterium]